MNTNSFKTVSQRAEDVKRDWHVIDATGLVVGRLASKVASVLRGKHKPNYTPHADVGDFVVVLNAPNVQITGRKAENKVYLRYTGYPGGQVEESYARMRERHLEDIIRLAVRRMMPKTNLGRHMLRKLKIYAGQEHPHHAQKPEVLAFGTGVESRE